MPSPHPLGPADPGQIGEYRLTAVLGQGGQGTVYLGRTASGDEVAVKVLHAHLVEDPEARRRFLRETDLARRVAPFCTARVLDAGMHQDRPYIASEYVPGHSLQQVMRNDGPRTGSALDRLAVTTATALAAIHRAGIVHRDFKPSNVILGPEGPVVIDFGVARTLDHTATRSGSVGTPAYIAPEQLTQDTVGQAADIFSWAGTMVYAATGHLAFPGDSVPALLHAILHRDPDLSGVPEGLRPLLARCLAKDPAARPTAADLVRILTGDGPAATPSPAPTAPTAPTASAASAVSAAGPAYPTAPAFPVSPASPAGPAAMTPLPESTAVAPAGPVRARLIPRRALVTVTVAVAAVAVVLLVWVWPQSKAGGGASSRSSAEISPPDRTPSHLRTSPLLTSPLPASPLPTPSLRTPAESRTPLPFGAVVGAPITDHDNDVRSVATGRIDGVPVIVTGSDDETVRVVDLRTRRQRGEALRGHTEWVRSVAFGQLDGTPIAVSAADDDTLRVWDLNTGTQRGTPMTGHDGDVKAVAFGRLDGAPIAVSAGTDATVRVWDLRTGEQRGTPITGHTGGVWAVALGQLDGAPVVVSTGDDGTIRVWNLRTGERIGPALRGHRGWVRSVALGQLDGVPIAVTGGEDGTARVWDLRGRRQLTVLRGHTGEIWSVALGRIGDVPIAITGGEDRTARVWNLRTGKQIGSPLTGHGDRLWAVAFDDLDGRPVAITASRDETVRVWSLGSP
ncbi:protein kinase [Streptosporangium sp. NPDC051022]|uniref:serine/threonine-protein kinase n=1 Tax=Streptosporangium sp. NPDC051022 TaxID=3155752 RepID=UPI00343311AF